MSSEDDCTENECIKGIEESIDELCKEGETYLDGGAFRLAYDRFDKALKLIPEPKKEQETTTWILGQLAEIYHQLQDFKAVKKALIFAMECPGGVENPFLQLRLGQAYYELDEMDQAKLHLQIALDKEGQTIFGFDDPKYHEFITAH
jgi:tetratricopeptide (TPR) repeat protein